MASLHSVYAATWQVYTPSDAPSDPVHVRPQHDKPDGVHDHGEEHVPRDDRAHDRRADLPRGNDGEVATCTSRERRTYQREVDPRRT